ncbi:MAG TPA: MFS transporter [Pseudolabrys sp.]|nr:MFS transporter [Pseudolabrys sp.]
MSVAQAAAASEAPGSNLINRLIEGVTMFVVAAASLFLLLYVGFGDGRRTYESIHIEKITSQGLLVRDSIEKFLRDGLPLKQYAGFTTLVAPLLESDDVDAIAVYNQAGKQLFIGVDRKKPALPEPAEAIRNLDKGIQVDKGPTHYQVVLPLRTRFETAGSVVVMSPASLVSHRMAESFVPLIFLVLGLSAVFAVAIVVAKPYLARLGSRYLQIAYGCTFMAMAVFVVATLVGLYFDGIQGKAKASAFTMAQRLTDIVDFKLSFQDFDGIERTFSDYRKLNPEVSEAAVLFGNKVEITSDRTRKAPTWAPADTNFEYKLPLAREGAADGPSFAITVPKSIIFERVLRSVKNFAALFIASAFLAGLFLQVAGSIQGLRTSDGKAQEKSPVGNDAALVLIKPVFFLSVFLDALTYSFLPKFMQQVAIGSGYSVGFASAPFTAYYLCFALSLIPAGTVCDRRGPKPIIIIGLLIAAASVVGLTLPMGLWGMTALRGLAGIGQGLLIIGVQSYILAVASPEKKTQGAAIIVFGFQGGLISGMALGSLMVNFLQTKGIFAISGGVGAATLIYTLLLVPTSKAAQAQGGFKAAVRKLGNDLKNVVTSLEFLNTLVCIGMPAKAILTGIITFAIPLVLGQAGYRSEDIGQIVMLYGLGVVASSGYVSRLVDRTKNTERILFIGAVASGIGLTLIGLTGTSMLGNGLLSTVVIIFAVSLVGVAHGFINAPVVTHVVQSSLAKSLGVNPVSTAYRFLERGGHVAGPLIVSQLFLVWGQGPQILGGVGIVVAILGIMFVARRLIPTSHRLHAEPAE